MTFNSLSFVLFLPVVYLIFFFTADRWRWGVLLLASYAFYAFLRVPHLLAVLFLVTLTSYLTGLQIAARSDDTARRRWLWGGTVACVAILSVLKYLPFFLSEGNPGKNTSLLVSIGVSYFVFQAISYMVDVYLEMEEPERNFGFYALYLAFFPKLLQGPIERAGDLLPQLRKTYTFDYDAIRSGMLLFTWGLLKKMVIADRLALYADQVFNNAHDYSGVSLLVGTYAYALQIYFDFSAYTDMARGIGQIFGIKLTENFNRPYLATSVAEFWRRWHISFSRWILDYIFKPLQMGWRQWGQAGTAAALIITFLVSGIWHGASWGFVIWGLIHGIYLAASTYYRPYQKKIHKWLRIDNTRLLKVWQAFATFNLVSFAWIFFRAKSLSDAVYIVGHIFQPSIAKLGHLVLFNGKRELLFLIAYLFVVPLAARWVASNDFSDLRRFAWPLRWAVYFVTVMSVLIFWLNSDQKFIYTRF